MKGLPNLIRLHKRGLEEQQRELGELEAVKNRFVGRIQDLDAEVAAEGAAAGDSPETGHVLGGYVQAALQRRRHLEESVDETLAKINQIRDQVAAAFQELKRFELADEMQRDRARKHLRQQERNKEDEMGIDMFRRHQNGGEG